MDCHIICMHRELLKNGEVIRVKKHNLSSVGMRDKPLWETRFQPEYIEKPDLKQGEEDMCVGCDRSELHQVKRILSRNSLEQCVCVLGVVVWASLWERGW